MPGRWRHDRARAGAGWCRAGPGPRVCAGDRRGYRQVLLRDRHAECHHRRLFRQADGVSPGRFAPSGPAIFGRRCWDGGGGGGGGGGGKKKKKKPRASRGGGAWQQGECRDERAPRVPCRRGTGGEGQPPCCYALPLPVTAARLLPPGRQSWPRSAGGASRRYRGVDRIFLVQHPVFPAEPALLDVLPAWPLCRGGESRYSSGGRAQGHSAGAAAGAAGGRLTRLGGAPRHDAGAPGRTGDLNPAGPGLR